MRIYNNNDNDDLSVRLRDLLSDDDNDEVVKNNTPKKSLNKYSRQRDYSGRNVIPVISTAAASLAPTLGQLEQGGSFIKKELRNIDISDNEREDKKREMMGDKDKDND